MITGVHIAESLFAVCVGVWLSWCGDSSMRRRVDRWVVYTALAWLVALAVAGLWALARRWF